VSNADVQRFDTVSRQVGTAATTYGAQAASMQDVVTCDSLQGTYDGQVRPMVGVLLSMGGRMDRQMDGMGHMADGDMACSADAMQAELDRHRGGARPGDGRDDGHDGGRRRRYGRGPLHPQRRRQLHLPALRPPLRPWARR
jgi:hypothetical protein